jgi:ACS family hexuronate transporter-like MFS transporter
MKIRGLRWWIVALLFGAAVLNYVDRQTLSALAPTIQTDLGMDDRDYANIVNIFLVAYTIAYLLSGRLVDTMGTRLGMSVFVVWWSIANMLTALATGVTSLGVYRFLLGLGEAGVWPAASKAVAEWFPAKERAVAIGIYTMGATAGAMLAPYIVIPLATFDYSRMGDWIGHFLGHGHGWRIAFILTGAAGFLWLLPWAWLYRTPAQNRFITQGELSMIREDAGLEGASTAHEKPWTWMQVFAFRGTWLLLLARLISDPVWYFYQFWFPKYLSADRHLDQSQLTITWVIYAAAGIGSLAGGWFSGRLVNRGMAPTSSRMAVMLGCALLMPLSPLIAWVTDLNFSLVLACVTVVAALAWLINISSLVVDVVPKHSLGTVFSVVAAGSTLGGIVMNTLVGSMVSGPSTKPPGFLDSGIQWVFGGVMRMVEGEGYAMWFWVMLALHPIAWLILKFGKIEKL